MTDSKTLLTALVIAPAGVLLLAYSIHSPTKPTSVPSLPVMSSLGLGILIGGVVIGACIYLWKRPRQR